MPVIELWMWKVRNQRSKIFFSFKEIYSFNLEPTVTLILRRLNAAKAKITAASSHLLSLVLLGVGFLFGLRLLVCCFGFCLYQFFFLR